MKKVAGKLRLELAQYRALAAFAQFASDLDKASQQQLARGSRMVELLKQPQYAPLSMEKQVVIIYAGLNGYVDELPIGSLRRYEVDLFAYLASQRPQIMDKIRDSKDLDKDNENLLKDALVAFGKQFVVDQKA
jgi:F-type H+-transporting ATPase subunit alpha